MRTLVIGTGGSGATNLVSRHCNNSFHEGYIPDGNLGLEFQPHTTELAHGDVIKNRIWDHARHSRSTENGGVDIYARANSTSAVIIAYDITELYSFEIAKNQYRSLLRNGGHSVNSFALVGTKTDLEVNRQVSTAEAAKFAAENGMLHFECSAKTGHNVNKVFDAVVQNIAEKKKVDMSPPPLTKEERDALKKELKKTIAGEARALSKIGGNRKDKLKVLAESAEKTKTSKLTDDGLRDAVKNARDTLEVCRDRKPQIGDNIKGTSR